MFSLSSFSHVLLSVWFPLLLLLLFFHSPSTSSSRCSSLPLHSRTALFSSRTMSLSHLRSPTSPSLFLLINLGPLSLFLCFSAVSLSQTLFLISFLFFFCFASLFYTALLLVFNSPSQPFFSLSRVLVFFIFSVIWPPFRTASLSIFSPLLLFSRFLFCSLSLTFLFFFSTFHAFSFAAPYRCMPRFYINRVLFSTSLTRSSSLSFYFFFCYLVIFDIQTPTALLFLASSSFRFIVPASRILYLVLFCPLTSLFFFFLFFYVLPQP